MGFFSRKKSDKFLIEEDIPAFTLEINKDEEKTVHAPNVLTPEEILGKEQDITEEANEGETALEGLKKRIAAVAENTTIAPEEEVKEQIPDTAKIPENKPDDAPFVMPTSLPRKEMISSLEAKAEKTVSQPETIIKPEEKSETVIKTTAEKNENVKFSENPIFQEETEDVKETSLLDKCLPYIVDEDGKEAVDSKPLYKLQSVADILKNDSEKILESLSEKYEISFDDLGRGYKETYIPEEKTEEKPKVELPKKPEPEKEEKIKVSLPESQIFEETLPVKNKVKKVQSNVASVISDIDTPDISLDEPENKKISNTATITFTPVSDGSKSGSHITVSTQTRPIDLTGELVKITDSDTETTEEKVKLEKNEFEEYVPKEEIENEKDIPKFVRMLSIKKRRAFLQTVLSFFLTIILSISKLPFLSETLLSHTVVGMIICMAVTGIIILINGDMFISLPKALSYKCKPDVFAAIASVVTLTYGVFGILAGDIIVDMLILLSFILSFRALSKFFKSSYTLSNLKIIAQNGQKRAVKLIDDNAVTFAMVKNSIEGEALIAAPQKAENIKDYMKYSTFGISLGGRLPIMTVISIIMSAIVGFTCGAYFDGVVYGFYAAAAIQCFAALPVLFLVDNLPLYRTAKKLNCKGAMIAGKTGAQNIEMANAAVLNACDIFPSGTVTLHQMKVLSENNLEDTIIRAASLTESLDSPLTPIFKRIAGTGNITVFPDSDTVKYEDRMGISGWVDNRLLFIGNRTLMEAHGIEVPPVEVDRKILMQGYFPVYVATRDKACALLVIQYNVDSAIAYELRRLTNLGVTLLVNSCDPNLTEEMICDYLGLYDDSVKVMSAAGCHMYKNTVTNAKKVSAPAVYRSNPIALASIINCASKIKRSNLLLTIAYVVCACLGAVIFAYTSLGGSGTLISETTLLIYGIASTVASYLIYLLERP